MNISVLNILQASNDHELLGQQEHDFETERKCALGSEQAIAANGSPQETPPEYPTPIDIPEPTEIPDPVPHQDPVEIPVPERRAPPGEKPTPEIEPPQESLHIEVN